MLDTRLLRNLRRAGVNPAPTINLSELRLIWWGGRLCRWSGRLCPLTFDRHRGLSYQTLLVLANTVQVGQASLPA